jgi:uncharacterized membrane protein YdjX (TVP38/TMEM64 family)
MKLRTLLLIAGLLLLAVLLWHYRETIRFGLALAADRQALAALMQAYQGWGEAMAFLLLVLQVFFALIPGQALMVVCGYVFGFWKGLLITWTSLVLAGEVAFWLARRYGRPLAMRFVAPETLRRWDSFSFNQSIPFYVVTMLLPLFPNDAMCYIAGLTPMPATRFLAANMLARFIASLALVYLGAFGAAMPVSSWIVIAAGVALFVAIGWLVRKRIWVGEEKTP